MREIIYLEQAKEHSSEAAKSWMAVSGACNTFDFYHEFLSNGSGVYYFPKEGIQCKHAVAGAAVPQL